MELEAAAQGAEDMETRFSKLVGIGIAIAIAIAIDRHSTCKFSPLFVSL